MHELSLATSVVEYLEDLSREQGLKKIDAVYIEIGGMTHVDPVQFRFSFKLVCKGTAAEGCRLYIRKRSPILKCEECKKEVRINIKDLGSVSFRCPSCGGNLKIERGRELLLKRVKGSR